MEILWRGAPGCLIGVRSGGEIEAGQRIVPGNGDAGSPKPGPDPMELPLIGSGGCAAHDVVHILEKGREPVEHGSAALAARRAEAAPRVFTPTHLQLTVTSRVPDAK